MFLFCAVRLSSLTLVSLCMLVMGVVICSLCRVKKKQKTNNLPTLISPLYFSITCFLWLSPKREEWWRESTLRKTLLFIFSTVQKSTSLRPPTPIPVLRLRKQVNQTQRPVGCETSPGPAPSRRSHQSFHVDFRGEAKTHTHTQKHLTQLFLSELVSVLNSALAAAQAAAV